MSRSSRRSDSFNDAFDGLFAAAYSTALQVLGDEQEAEDTAVEAMARTYARWARLEGRPWRGDWVVLNTLELSLDVVKRSGTATPDGGDPEGAIGPQARDHDREIVAIAALPRREREVIALRDLAGRSIADCAAVLRISERAVAGLSDRGMAHLRDEATVEPTEEEVVAESSDEMDADEPSDETVAADG